MVKEQIQKLAEQAGDSLVDSNFSDWNIPNEFVEKFAQLVWEEAYQAGFDQGRQEGFDDGYEQAQASAEYNSGLDD
jgi:hypothetical protein